MKPHAVAGMSLLVVGQCGLGSLACSGETASNEARADGQTGGASSGESASTNGSTSGAAASTNGGGSSAGGSGGMPGNSTSMVTSGGPLVVPSGPFHASQVEASGLHVCALTPEAEVACWGRGPTGSASENEFFPVRVAGLGASVAVKTSGTTACALSSEGTLACWGSGAYGQLGNGVSGDGYWETAPVEVQGLAEVVDVTLNGGSVCAVTVEGSVWCWGHNLGGRLGFESEPCGPFAFQTDTVTYQEFECQETPRQVPGVSGAVEIARSSNNPCALLEDGNVACWAGINPMAPEEDRVQLVSGLSDVTKLRMGGSQACALRADATLWCWGNNSQGQLGQGSNSETSSAVPLLVEGLGPVIDFDVNGDSSCALTQDGTVHCWGNVVYTLASEDWPTANTAVARVPTPAPYVSDAVFLSTGGAVTCVRSTSDRVHCWGASADGATGNGRIEDATDFSADPVVW